LVLSDKDGNRLVCDRHTYACDQQPIDGHALAEGDLQGPLNAASAFGRLTSSSSELAASPRGDRLMR
jgi:hypothetical protein